MAEVLKEKKIRLSTEPQSPDDFSFILEGQRYYMDKAVATDKDMLALRAIRELEQERKENIALKMQLLKFQAKAADCAETLKKIAFPN